MDLGKRPTSALCTWRQCKGLRVWVAWAWIWVDRWEGWGVRGDRWVWEGRWDKWVVIWVWDREDRGDR
jgi:hypothetical protein